ncbi:hypothetical protein AEGHOMDF_4724 [Methylobacterium soli]|nr:hypothetical protein AEGHOMDF_4724 [Methylobacterium soli]
MVALSASRLVWSAMDLIIPTKFSTWPAFSESVRMVASVVPAWAAICWARSETRPTRSEISWIARVICSEPAATEAARSRAPPAERVSPSAESRISWAAALTISTTCETSEAIWTCPVTIDQVSIGPI